MKKSPNKTINNLINKLPPKDISIAKKLIEKRDFNSLFELVNSAIIKIEKSLDIDQVNSEYINLDIEALYELQNTINNYLILIGDYEDYEDEDYSNIEINDTEIF